MPKFLYIYPMFFQLYPPNFRLKHSCLERTVNNRVAMDHTLAAIISRSILTAVRGGVPILAWTGSPHLPLALRRLPIFLLLCLILTYFSQKNPDFLRLPIYFSQKSAIIAECIYIGLVCVSGSHSNIYACVLENLCIYTAYYVSVHSQIKIIQRGYKYTYTAFT